MGLGNVAGIVARNVCTGVSGVAGVALQAPSCLGVVLLTAAVARAVEKYVVNHFWTYNPTEKSPTACKIYYTYSITQLFKYGAAALLTGLVLTRGIHCFAPNWAANANTVARFASMQFQPICLKGATAFLKNVPVLNKFC